MSERSRGELVNAALLVTLAGLYVVAGRSGLWKRLDPRPFWSSQHVRMVLLAVAVALAAFGASQLAAPIDRSAVAATTSSAAAGTLFAWLAFRWRGVTSPSK